MSSHAFPPLGVPAYFGPWERASWSALLDATPAVAVINPDTGPGRRRHAGYRPLVRRLQGRGTTVLGYVATGWLRNHDWAESAARHLRWYGVDGILWDEIPVDDVPVRAIRQLVDWSSAQQCRAQAFNPGRPVPASWRRLAIDAWWVTFEGTGRAYLELRDGPVTLPAAGDWHLVHSVTERDRSKVRRALAERSPSLAFTTGDRLPNPWDVFPGDATAPRRAASSDPRRSLRLEVT